MAMMCRWLCVLLVLQWRGVVTQSSSFVSDVFDCQTMLPQGQSESSVQTALPPALFLLSNLTYKSTQQLTVTVESEVPLSACIIEVFQTADNSSSQPQGTWSLPAVSTPGLITYSCTNQLDTAVFIQSGGDGDVYQVQVLWTPSVNTHGPVEFMSTVITSNKKFWFIDQSVQELVSSPSNPDVGYQLSLEQLQALNKKNIQQQIMGYQLQQQSEITDEMTGNEGNWSRTRELEREAEEAAQQQKQFEYEHKKAAEQQQQQQMYQFEKSDREIYGVRYFNPPPSGVQTTPYNVPTIPGRNNNNVSGTANTLQTKMHIVGILATIIAIAVV